MYQSDIQLGHVALNVNDLERLTAFYHQRLGMRIIDQNETQTRLGVGGSDEPLIVLQKVTTSRVPSYGLYHVALLLPSRADLGDFLFHALSTSLPLIGASDHGYSEAIYLEDPEGNGIEIYRDLPVSSWVIRDGQIIGKTEAIDAEGVLASRRLDTEGYTMPSGTTMGHVHLSVRDQAPSARWFERLLGTAIKFAVPTGSWLASGMYHHHLAVNEWAGKQLADNDATRPGLAYFEVFVHDDAVLQRIKARAAEYGATVLEDTAQGIVLEGPNHIVIQIKRIPT